jgi:hypothetical protein
MRAPHLPEVTQWTRREEESYLLGGPQATKGTILARVYSAWEVSWRHAQ